MQKNQALRSLDISENNISNITDKDLSDDGVLAFSDSLKTNNNLKVLKLSVVANTPFKLVNQIANKLAEAIQLNIGLQVLHLGSIAGRMQHSVSFNVIILTALLNNNTLVTLHLPWIRKQTKSIRDILGKIKLERKKKNVNELTVYLYNI